MNSWIFRKKQLSRFFIYGHMPPWCKHHHDGDQTDIDSNYGWSGVGGAWLVTIPGVIVGLLWRRQRRGQEVRNKDIFLPTITDRREPPPLSHMQFLWLVHIRQWRFKHALRKRRNLQNVPGRISRFRNSPIPGLRYHHSRYKFES